MHSPSVSITFGKPWKSNTFSHRDGYNCEPRASWKARQQQRHAKFPAKHGPSALHVLSTLDLCRNDSSPVVTQLLHGTTSQESFDFTLGLGKPEMTGPSADWGRRITKYSDGRPANQ
ncbi:unnamed protein product [Xylocopa violacea]|uniref:Uncharacterized protein n=1 Tax=Xylocopa violacea TaxID=135666 RepID=A0ABP1NBH7_XYLVO